MRKFCNRLCVYLDNGDPGQIEYETLTLPATVNIEGIPVHPGEAAISMVNANTLGRQFRCRITGIDRLEFSAGHEGHFLLLKFHGEISDELVYIIRDFDHQHLEARKAYFQKRRLTLTKRPI